MWKPNLSNANETMHRNHLTLELLFSWLCSLNSKMCVSNPFTSDHPLNTRLSIHVELRKLCADMREANASILNELFDKYKHLFKNTTNQIMEFNALGCSANGDILKR